MDPNVLPPTHSVFEELQAIYRELEEELQLYQSLCTRLSRCCHFKDFGHRLYSLSLEVAFLQQQIPLPEKTLPPLTCPYLNLDGSCGNRTGRPLGCRIFFCDPGYQPTAQLFYEKYHRKLEQLLHKYQLDYVYGEMTAQLSQLNQLPVTKVIKEVQVAQENGTLSVLK
ncbi:MAG: hypothetical protein AABZ60_00595 [Planctomycetota bacterium]